MKNGIALKILKTVLTIVVFKLMLSSLQDFISLIPLFLTPLFMDGFPLPFDLNIPADPAPDADHDVYHPLTNDRSLRVDLFDKLKHNSIGLTHNNRPDDYTINRAVNMQIAILKKVELVLKEKKYDPQVVLEQKNEIINFIFYPQGHSIHFDALELYANTFFNDLESKAFIFNMEKKVFEKGKGVD